MEFTFSKFMELWILLFITIIFMKFKILLFELIIQIQLKHNITTFVLMILIFRFFIPKQIKLMLTFFQLEDVEIYMFKTI